MAPSASCARGGAEVMTVEPHPEGSDRWRKEVEEPFRRLDANPDAMELARLALCLVTIVPARLLLIAVLVPLYYLLARLWLASTPDTRWAHDFSIGFVKRAARLLLVLMGFWKVEVVGWDNAVGREGEPRIFVSNHISYVEILYFLAELGPSFVMKRTCLQVPLIGSIASRILDSVSVDNKGGKEGGSGSYAIGSRLVEMFGPKALMSGDWDRSHAQQNEESNQSDPKSWRGRTLLLFPEGTTSNGSCLLRFRTGVFAGGMPVYPVAVQYDYKRFSPGFESIYFPVQIIRMLAEPANYLRVEYLPRHDPTPEERADRGVYASAIQAVLCRTLGLPAVDAGYTEKIKFHKFLRKKFSEHPWGKFALLLVAPDRHYAMLGVLNKESRRQDTEATGDEPKAASLPQGTPSGEGAGDETGIGHGIRRRNRDPVVVTGSTKVW